MGGGGSVSTKPGPMSNTLATISRDEFNTWRNRYRPQTSALIREVNNPITLSRNLANVSKSVGDSFGSQAINLKRNLSRMGVEATPQQQAAINRQSSIAQAGMDVAARANIRDATKERDASIIGGL